MSNPEIIGPVSPERAAELHTERIPNEIFEVFNGLIAKHLVRGSSKVLQKDVLADLESRGLPSDKIFSEKWLDVEPSYREQGWSVHYVRPIYYAGDDFDAYFEFKDPKYVPPRRQNW